MKRICCLTGAIILLVSASSCRQATDVSQDAVAATPEDAPHAVAALALLNASLETSEATGKRVLVHLSSPGCAPCRLLELMFHENATRFEKDFVVLGIDQATMVNGQVVMEMVGSTGSTPWVSILDSNGNVIADS